MAISEIEEKRRSLMITGLTAAVEMLKDAEDDGDVILGTEFVFEIVKDIKMKRSSQALEAIR